MKKELDNQLVKPVEGAPIKTPIVAVKATKRPKNPTKSTAVQSFLDLIPEEAHKELFPLIEDGKVILVDDVFIKNTGTKERTLRENLKVQTQNVEILKERALKTARERDVYGQFFYDWIDMFVKTPAFLNLLDKQSREFIKVLEKAIVNPNFKANEQKMAKKLIGKIFMILLMPKNMRIIGEHMSKIDFNSPTSLLLAGGKIPAELKPLQPQLEKAYAMVQTYQSLQKTRTQK